MKLSRVHGNLTEKIKEQRRAGFFIGQTGDQTALKASWTESVDPFFYYKSRCLVLVDLNVL